MKLDDLKARLLSWDGTPFDDDAHEAAQAITDLEALVGELGEALVTAMIPIEAMLLSGADAAHCQDVRDAMHDAQATARATLAKLEKARGKDQEHG